MTSRLSFEVGSPSERSIRRQTMGSGFASEDRRTGAPGAIRTPDLLVRSQIQSNLASLVVSVTCNSFRISGVVDLR
jgi:hypothetical protein